ncbi:uncharacterized protein VTP21DRAFT_11286 [Calcarisporiella thermophila]|uniref:uncharacterized protein n=1 Tax=Calcarisporiella thermophila TaxID=911321 RepID=UPI0037439FFE
MTIPDAPRDENGDSRNEPAAVAGKEPKDNGAPPPPSQPEKKPNQHIRFAPLNIPLRRRRQTFGVLVFFCMMSICLGVFFLLCAIPFAWPFVISYLVWSRFDRAPENGGRPLQWVRRMVVWRWFAEFFPIRAIKEGDLDPSKNYIFGYHPHGIIGMGAWANFATEGTGFSELFPGVKPHLLTLTINFTTPFYRDWLMAHGVCAVSRSSCFNILNKGPGNSIVIVIGGATESLLSRPGTMDLALRRRHGFIKLALQTGASLVPVLGFGENDIFDQIKNERDSFLFKFQKQFQRIFSFTLPLFHGRGIFNYDYGLLPHRRPIVVVYGKPIPTQKKTNITADDIAELQEQYIDALKEIWEKYKDTYAPNRIKELTIVE